jgi:hypothetical protein
MRRLRLRLAGALLRGEGEVTTNRFAVPRPLIERRSPDLRERFEDFSRSRNLLAAYQLLRRRGRPTGGVRAERLDCPQGRRRSDAPQASTRQRPV